jgi:hypothetical protein
MHISWMNIPLEVDYDYQPAERPCLDYPGCEAELVLNKVSLRNPDDLLELLINLDLVAQVEAAMLARLADSNSEEESSCA